MARPSALFGGLPDDQTVWMSHRDAVTAAPAGFRVTASTEDSPVAAMEDLERGLCGVQFHPEVIHTPYGQEVLQRFLYDVCGARAHLDQRLDHRGVGGGHPAARSAMPR